MSSYLVGISWRDPEEVAAYEVFCWLEENPEQSSWRHCLGFFQRVSVGEYPDYHKMTTEAYSEWCEKMGMS